MKMSQRLLRATGKHLFPANRKTPVKHVKGIKVCSSKKVTRLTAQLKCIYSYVHSMGNK